MGQCWRLVDIDGRVGCYLPSPLEQEIWSVNLHGLLLSRGSSPLSRYLLPLKEICRERSKSEFGPLPPFHGQKQLRLLTLLPVDVLRLIFESFGSPDPHDMSAGIAAACFALTCQLCLEVGHPVLRRHQAAKEEAWWGHRIIIAGYYQNGDDLPKGLEVDPAWQMPKKNIYTETEAWPNRYFDLHDAVDNSGIFSTSAAKSRKEARQAFALKNLWCSMFRVRPRPRIAQPILRNLTTREYARADILDKMQRDPDVLDTFRKLRVGDLALFRICWSSRDDVDMNADNIVRGPWAGHRFDVVDFSKVDLNGWQDISKDLVREVAGI